MHRPFAGYIEPSKAAPRINPSINANVKITPGIGATRNSAGCSAPPRNLPSEYSGCSVVTQDLAKSLSAQHGSYALCGQNKKYSNMMVAAANSDSRPVPRKGAPGGALGTTCVWYGTGNSTSRIDLGQSLLSQKPRLSIALRKSLLEDMGGTDDQIDRFCYLRRCRHNISTGSACGADSRTGQHDHASRRRMRSGYDTS